MKNLQRNGKGDFGWKNPAAFCLFIRFRFMATLPSKVAFPGFVFFIRFCLAVTPPRTVAFPGFCLFIGFRAGSDLAGKTVFLFLSLPGRFGCLWLFRIARDIHDSLGHRLTVINIQLEKAIAYRDKDPLEADASVHTAKHLGSWI